MARQLFAELRKRRKIIKLHELVLMVLFIAVVTILTITLVSKIKLKHDIASAQTVSSKVITAINNRNGTMMRSLGTAKFQRTYTATELTQDFKSVEIATLKMPTLDAHFIGDSPSGRTFFFIYKYSALKVPFYVRVAIVNQSGKWLLTAIDGTVDESQLF